LAALPGGREGGRSPSIARRASPTIERHPFGILLLALGALIAPGLVLFGAALSSFYGRTLTCERSQGRVDCRATATFFNHPHEIAAVPFATARIERTEHTTVSAAGGDDATSVNEDHDRYAVSLAPAAGPLGAKDHYEFSLLVIVPHAAPDTLDRLQSFLADPEQRSVTLILKRAEPFGRGSLGQLGCFAALVGLMVFPGVVLLRQSIGVLRRG